MKKSFVLVVPAILVAGLILFGLGDVVVADNEVASSISNSSASATITITMYTVTGE